MRSLERGESRRLVLALPGSGRGSFTRRVSLGRWAVASEFDPAVLPLWWEHCSWMFSLKQLGAGTGLVHLIPLVLILSSLNKLFLIWHDTHINRECSGLTCFRLTCLTLSWKMSHCRVTLVVAEPAVVEGWRRGRGVAAGQGRGVTGAGV